MKAIPSPIRYALFAAVLGSPFAFLAVGLEAKLANATPPPRPALVSCASATSVQLADIKVKTSGPVVAAGVLPNRFGYKVWACWSTDL